MSNEHIPSFMDNEGQQPNQSQQNFPNQVGTAASVPNTPSSGNAPQRKASTGFTNLRNYLQANQQNTLGQTVASKAQQQVGKAQQNIQSSEEQFAQAMQDQKSKLQGAAQASQQAGQYIETGDMSALQQPQTTQAVPADDQDAFRQANEQARQQFQNLRDYSYTGPQNLQNEQQLASDRFAIQDFAKATGSEAGRGAILQTQFGGTGQYGSGMRNLDNLILSSNQDDLNRLKDIRSQSRGYDQRLRDLLGSSQSKLASMYGNIDVEKAKQQVHMRDIRDRVKSALEGEADAYNQQMREDIAQVTPEELAQYIPNFTGWDVVNPEDLENAYVNLMYNKDLNTEGGRVVDDKNVIRTSHESAGSRGSGFLHESPGNPNARDIMLNMQALTPLFKETYQDNTWESINEDALRRRNVLSEVLGDEASLVPQERQEKQVQLVQDLYNQVSHLPKTMQDEYVQNLFGNAAWGGKTYGTDRIYSGFMNLGFDNPLKALQSAKINFNLPKNSSTGFTFINNDPKLGNPFDYTYNPETNMMEINKTYYGTTKEPVMRKTQFGTKQATNAQGQPIFREVTNQQAPFAVQNAIPLDQFQQMTNQVSVGSGWHDQISPAAIAGMDQKAGVYQKLKQLLGADPNQIDYRRENLDDRPNITLPINNSEEI
jgi:hypothetical protein